MSRKQSPRTNVQFFSSINLVCHLCRAQLILCRSLILCKCMLIFHVSQTGLMHTLAQAVAFHLDVILRNWLTWKNTFLGDYQDACTRCSHQVFTTIQTQYMEKGSFSYEWHHCFSWISFASLKRPRPWKVDTLFTVLCSCVIILRYPRNSCVIPRSHTRDKNSLYAQENTCNDEVCCVRDCCAGHIFQRVFIHVVICNKGECQPAISAVKTKSKCVLMLYRFFFFQLVQSFMLSSKGYWMSWYNGKQCTTRSLWKKKIEAGGCYQDLFSYVLVSTAEWVLAYSHCSLLSWLVFGMSSTCTWISFPLTLVTLHSALICVWLN